MRLSTLVHGVGTVLYPGTHRLLHGALKNDFQMIQNDIKMI